MLVSIGEAAELIGVSRTTLRRWEKEKKFSPKSRTIGGHRRYCLFEIKELFYPQVVEEKFESKVNIAYARVSSHDQKLDLKRQEKKLMKYSRTNKLRCTLYSDLGSGLNFKKPKLKKVIRMICAGKVNKLIINHKDRLLRFGFPLIQQLCHIHDTQIIILEAPEKQTFEEELANDLIELITVFSSRVYGRRAHTKRISA